LLLQFHNPLVSFIQLNTQIRNLGALLGRTLHELRHYLSMGMPCFQNLSQVKDTFWVMGLTYLRIHPQSIQIPSKRYKSILYHLSLMLRLSIPINSLIGLGLPISLKQDAHSQWYTTMVLIARLLGVSHDGGEVILTRDN